MTALEALNLAAPLADTYNSVEQRLLVAIARQLSLNDNHEMNEVSKWQIKRLAGLGMLRKDAAKIIAAGTKGVPSDFSDTVRKAISSALAEDGLFGINCGHRPRGCTDGVFTRSAVEYDDEADKELYNKVCKQRELERNVRKSKTEADMLEAAGDTEGAKEVRRKMSEQNKALRAYCEGNGLKYRSNRVKTYGAVAPKKTLDKSDESGIIKKRSDSVALEYQRYGRNKSTLVNKTYIDSGEYRRKFDNATANPEVNKSLYNCAKTALKHRSGTVYEDMYWIDSHTGKILLSVTDSTDERAIVYTEKIKKSISMYSDIITVHSHPSSMPPSVSDLNSCCRNHYKMGLVACHDGRVFAYSSNEIINERIYSAYIERFLKDGFDEYNAQIKALERLTQNFDVSVWEVFDND